MDHDEASRLVPTWQGGDLDPETAAAVDGHVASCETCQQRLDDHGPVDLPAAGLPESWSPESMRRGVRRTLWRTAFDTASLLLVVVIVGWLVSILVMQPLVSRGDRSERTLQATADLPVMLTPGAQLVEWRADAGWADRTMWAQVGLPTGAQITATGQFQLSLDLFSVDVSPSSLNPVSWTDVRWRPEELPAEARATVLLAWNASAVSPATVDALGRSDGVGLTWVGFDLGAATSEAPSATSDQFGPLGGGWARPVFDAPGLPPTVLGYSACQGPSVPEGAGAGTFGSSAGGGLSPVPSNGGGSTQALQGLRQATANLAADPDLEAMLEASGHHSLQQIEDTSSWLADNQPDIRTVVLTGRVDALESIIEQAQADQALQLAATLYNGNQEVCS